MDFGKLQKVEKVEITQNIIELESLVETCESGFVQINRNDLSKNLEVPLPVRHNISIQQIVRITESVKNKILDWTLELEEKGIKGENMSFNEKEKEKVKEMGDTITNVYGNQQIMQNSKQVINTNDIKKEIDYFIKKLEEGANNQEFSSKISVEEMKKIKEEIQILKIEINKSELNKGKIEKSLNFMKEIFMRTTTSLIAGGLLGIISNIKL